MPGSASSSRRSHDEGPGAAEAEARLDMHFILTGRNVVRDGEAEAEGVGVRGLKLTAAGTMTRSALRPGCEKRRPLVPSSSEPAMESIEGCAGLGPDGVDGAKVRGREVARTPGSSPRLATRNLRMIEAVVVMCVG